jgi:putative phage-type endonuclease
LKINATKLYHTKDMPREQWLKCRQEGIGGSDAAVIVGLNKNKTPLNTYIEKVEPLEIDEEENEYMEWGNLHEPTIREKFKRVHPDLIVRQSHFMWQHPEHKFMLANVDGFLYHKDKGWGVLEIKTASEYRLKEWGGGEVPEEYLIQAQHYLAVLGLNWGWFAVLIGGNKYREFYFERDDELIEYLIELEGKFWHENVLAGVPPMIDGTEASTQILNMLFPAANTKGNDTEIELPETAAELIDQYDAACEQVAAATELKNEAANKLKQIVGDYQKAYYEGRKIRWTKSSSTKFDKKSFEKEHPDLLKKYSIKSEYRRFSVS